MLKFDRGSRYMRPDVKEIAGLPREAKGGNWDTALSSTRMSLSSSPTSEPEVALGTTSGTAGKGVAFVGTTRLTLISDGRASKDC